jgi:hypothetical protein
MTAVKRECECERENVSLQHPLMSLGSFTSIQSNIEWGVSWISITHDSYRGRRTESWVPGRADSQARAGLHKIESVRRPRGGLTQG